MAKRQADEPKVPGIQRGGQEPAPEEHDRPEQNEGYDEAVRGGASGGTDIGGSDARLSPGPAEAMAPRESNDLDDTQTRAAVDEVRRQDKPAE
jgi:hypothetical protein